MRLTDKNGIPVYGRGTKHMSIVSESAKPLRRSDVVDVTLGERISAEEYVRYGLTTDGVKVDVFEWPRHEGEEGPQWYAIESDGRLFNGKPRKDSP